MPQLTEAMAFGKSMKSPEYRAVNPMGKVPAIRHGDVVVTEAAAICAYLADAFPAAQVAPPLAGREFIAGGRFSAADVYLGSSLRWGMQFGTLPKRDEFVIYCDRLRRRPACPCVLQIDDALAKSMA